MKKRNCGAAQTARFGDMEAAAFCGAWIRSAGKYSTRQEHMARTSDPTVQQIEEVMRSEGWMT